jgi:hypothetical protein
MSDVFLGMLRSEYDAPDEVPPEFVGMSNLAESISAAWLNATLDAPTSLALLSTVVLSGTDGTDWAPGAATGRWYRRRGAESEWHVAHPPTADATNPGWAVCLTAATDHVAEKLYPDSPSPQRG